MAMVFPLFQYLPGDENSAVESELFSVPLSQCNGVVWESRAMDRLEKLVLAYARSKGIVVVITDAKE
ncbi:hypothetical protein E4U58_006954 [Claviceps cyperi]|nr:hypothetical protein E4U58_006954 [Claviceps cyperi]